MKLAIKLILVTIITVLLILNMPIYSKAEISLESILDDGNSFLNTGSEGVTAGMPSESELQNISNSVSGILLTIAVIITLISAVIMGINFTIQSVEDKAKIKESMVPWIIGIFVSFGAYGIWRITMSIFYQF